MDTKNLVNFVFELDQLRIVKNAGGYLLGIETPKSNAAHSLRVAQIAFVLAHMEGYENPFEVCTMGVFHEIAECRIGDIHKLANRYVVSDEVRAVKEQTQSLGSIGEQIKDLWTQAEEKSTTAGIICKDADRLEYAFTGKEFMEKGYPKAVDWIDAVEKMVQTDSAKKLIKDIREMNSLDWWKGLKKYTY